MGRGIEVFEYNEATGEFVKLSEESGVDNPNYLAIHKRNLRVYAVSEVWGWNEGVVTAYQLDSEKGTLSYINKQPTLGSITAYVSIDHTNRSALVANYIWCANPNEPLPDQSVVSYPVRGDGVLDTSVPSFAHKGRGRHARRERSRAHYIQPTPDNRFAVVTDLDLDKVFVYRLDSQSVKLTPANHPNLGLPPGSGRRHFAFHPSGRVAYVINELNSTVAALSFDSTSGVFTRLRIVSALPADVTDDFEEREGNQLLSESHCSDLHFSPNGRFL
jgi:6-phosphogluconolactonase